VAFGTQLMLGKVSEEPSDKEEETFWPNKERVASVHRKYSDCLIGM